MHTTDRVSAHTEYALRMKFGMAKVHTPDVADNGPRDGSGRLYTSSGTYNIRGNIGRYVIFSRFHMEARNVTDGNGDAGTHIVMEML